MQFIILLALLLATTTWIVRSYHQLEQLRVLAYSNWQLVLASLHRRNDALHDLISRLSTRDKADMQLRQLRHVQGDYELSLSSNKVARKPLQQLQQIAKYESKLSQILGELSIPAMDEPKLRDCYEQVKQLDQIRLHSIKQYNAAVTAYQQRSRLSPYRQLAQLAQLPELKTWDTQDLLR